MAHWSISDKIERKSLRAACVGQKGESVTDCIRSCNVLMQNNQFIFKLSDQAPFNIWFGGIKKSQYRPFYEYLAEETAKRAGVGFERMSEMEIHLLMPDDALHMDLRLIKAFFMSKLHFYKIDVTYQSLYLSRDEKNYVALTKTCRCVAMKYIKAGRLIQECYLPVSTEKEEITSEMALLHSDIVLGKTPVFLIDNQMDMAELLDFGSMISSSEIMKNYEYSKAGR